MKRILLALSFLLAGSAAPVKAELITPAVTYDTSSTNPGFFSTTLGYAFQLSETFTVNALGYWDDGRLNAHRVGIWDSGGTLLASTRVLGTDPLTAQFRYSAINPVVLDPGTYTIGGEFLGNGDPIPSNVTNVVPIAGFTWLGARFSNATSGLNYPSEPATAPGPYGYLVVNFSVLTAAPVPEPSSLVLASLGGIGLLGYARLRRPPRGNLIPPPRRPQDPRKLSPGASPSRSTLQPAPRQPGPKGACPIAIT